LVTPALEQGRGELVLPAELAGALLSGLELVHEYQLELSVERSSGSGHAHGINGSCEQRGAEVKTRLSISP